MPGCLLNRRNLLAGASWPALAGSRRPPNFVLILVDNLGYGDLGCYGSSKHRTPRIDRMAREGVRFTGCYSASGVCTPSRAALLTGCYPRRVGLHYTDPDGAVLRPISRNGLHPGEVTVAEVLRQRGYATAMVGKWHLGDQPPFLPTRQGFDWYFGIPYSDDQVGNPKAKPVPWPPLPLMENEEVIEAPVDRDQLTRRYTEKCVEWIERNRQRPFFLYLPHAMPGSTASPHSSAAFRGKSANGAYGDSVEELDWSTGRILDALELNGLDRDTLVVWTSDNGAVQRNPVQGSNLPLGGWGYTTGEGGQRIPCIARWPGRIPGGRTCSALATLMDWMPTFAAFAHTRPARGRVIDGKDLGPLLTGRTPASPHEAFYYYYGPQLQAVRADAWKLVLPLEKKMVTLAGGTAPGRQALYDVVGDPGETTDLAAGHPDVVRRLTALAEKARAELGDVDRPGKGQRPCGVFENPTPRVLRTRGDTR
jgi:arylsulfatase A